MEEMWSAEILQLNFDSIIWRKYLNKAFCGLDLVQQYDPEFLDVTFSA